MLVVTEEVAAKYAFASAIIVDKFIDKKVRKEGDQSEDIYGCKNSACHR